MKNLFKTRRTKIYFGIITSAVFAMAIALFANFKPSLFRNASAVNDYTITFNRDNGGTGFPSSYGSGTNSNGHTSRGNPISFTYNNAKSTSNKFCTLASGGYLYNSTVLTGLESVNVTFSGGSLSLYSSKSTTFSGDAQSLTSGSALTIAANYDYFKLVASSETIIESIQVFYTCSAREEPEPEPVEVTDAITASDLPAKTTQYTSFTNLAKTSDARYAGNTAKDSSGNIQMRSKSSDTGFITTISGGNVKSVTITVGSGTNTINVYGSNSAYTGVSDLYSNPGTKVGSVSDTGTVTFTDDYQFVGIRSNSGAVYISKIEITWTSGSSGDVEKYSLTYNSNTTDTVTGMPNPATISNIEAGTSQPLTSATPSRDGYTFEGWSTTSGTNNAGNKVTGSITINSDTTLYAIWAEKAGDDTISLTATFSYSNPEPSSINIYKEDDSVFGTLATSISAVNSYSDTNQSYNIKMDEYILITNTYENVTIESIDVSFYKFDNFNVYVDGATSATYTGQGAQKSTSEYTETITTNASESIKILSNGGTGTYNWNVYSVTLHMTAYVGETAVSGVSLNKLTTTIAQESTEQLTATISPSYASNKNVTWSTSDGGVATVSNTGLVTGVGSGTATITVTTVDGGFTATCSVTVTAVYHVTGVSLNTSTLNLHPGDTSDLTATISPSNATNKNVAWSTSNSGVATVSNDGTVTAVAAGTATITVTTVDGNKTATCTVNVTNIAVTGVTLNKNSLTLTRTDSETLTADVSPSNATNKNVTWSSSNTSVATVSNSGSVTGVGAGTATITVTTVDGGKTATCTVTVNPIAVTGVSISETSLNLYIGNTHTLTATVSPSNADNQNVTWLSSNTSVATVSSSGVVTAKAAGSATITVTTVDGNYSKTCSVTVSKLPDATFVIDANTSGFSGAYSASDGSHTVTDSVTSASLTFTSSNVCVQSNSLQFRASPTGYIYSTTSLTLNTIEISGSGSFIVYGGTEENPTSNEISGSNGVYNLQGYTYFTIIKTSSGAQLASSITITTGTPEPITATGVNLPSTQEITIGDSKTLDLTYTPANANTGLDVTWTKRSGSSKISLNTSTGEVTVASNASTSDSAVIRATLNSNSSYAECTISVVEEQKAKYTILLYLCGSTLEYGKDTNGKYQLWGAATDDMTEILEASGTYEDDVNIVVETGGSRKWETTYGVSNSKLEVRHVENGSYVIDNQNVITSQGNMGSSSTLQTFLEYGLENYPADKTAVILWDHGAGIGGVCNDDNNSSDCLTTSEVANAVRIAKQNTGITTKLEWIGYDACLMGVADVASINADYFNYMVASQELEPGNGWDYKSWVSTLYNNPTSTSTILNSITTSYKNQYNNVSGCTDSTLAAYDLSYMSAFTTAFNSFADQLTTSDWNNLKSAYTSSMRFGDEDDDIYLYGLADMKIFMTKVATKITRLSTYASAVINALTNLVIYNKYCSYYSSSTGYPCGISVFFAGDTTQGGYPPQVSKTDYTTSDTKFTSWRSLNISQGEFYDS